jgi:hypothetical protein
MTKLIAGLIIAVVLFCGWRLFLYWDDVQHEEEIKRKEEAAREITTDEQLTGVPYQLENSLRTAKTMGATGLGNWLKAYGNAVQDPRKAWLQLDYCELISRQNVAEAKRLYQEVKGRTKPDSPVYKRVMKLQRTYE